jgi:hypothetical protein
MVEIGRVGAKAGNAPIEQKRRKAAFPRYAARSEDEYAEAGHGVAP